MAGAMAPQNGILHHFLRELLREIAPKRGLSKFRWWKSLVLGGHFGPGGFGSARIPKIIDAMDRRKVPAGLGARIFEIRADPNPPGPK